MAILWLHYIHVSRAGLTNYICIHSNFEWVFNTSILLIIVPLTAAGGNEAVRS